jgi:hypothetical protein
MIILKYCRIAQSRNSALHDKENFDLCFTEYTELHSMES